MKIPLINALSGSNKRTHNSKQVYYFNPTAITVTTQQPICKDSKSRLIIVIQEHILILFCLLLITDVGDHRLDILTDLHEVLVEDSFPLIVGVGCVELEIGLGSADTDLRLHKVACRLTTNPTGRHIQYLRRRHKAIHILIKIDGGLVTVYRYSFFNCTTFPKMSLDRYSRISFSRAEPLTTLPTVVMIFCIPTLP